MLNINELIYSTVKLYICKNFLHLSLKEKFKFEQTKQTQSPALKDEFYYFFCVYIFLFFPLKFGNGFGGKPWDEKSIGEMF